LRVEAELRPPALEGREHRGAGGPRRDRTRGVRDDTRQILRRLVQLPLDLVHFLSAGSMGFARGLNDTPKIVALLLVIKTFDVKFGMLPVAVAMAIGGLLNARKVAITMSKKITPLNPGQGFTANLVTSTLVILASRFGLPVSTTHVSVGSLFGIGLITREANGRVVSGILMSWLLTLPIAAILSAAIYLVVRLS